MSWLVIIYWYCFIGTHGEELPVQVLPPLPKPVPLAGLLGDKARSGHPKESPKGGETSAKGEKDDLVFLYEGLLPIRQKWVMAIEKGEFIDLAELLPKDPSWEEEAFTEVLDNIIVIAKNKPTKKKAINDIETWVEAFCTFAAIHEKKCPTMLPELLAYEATIVKAARDYGGQGWLAYDYRFRQMAAAKSLTTGWGQKDMAFWSDTFLKPKLEAGIPRPTDRASTGQGERLGKRYSPILQGSLQVTKRPKKSAEKAGWKSQICYPFSYMGKCTRDKCEFLHLCYDCGEVHSQSECPKKAVAT